MRLRLHQIGYIAQKVALDLHRSSLLTLQVPLESIAKIAHDILEDDIKAELAIDQKAQELLEKNQSEVEFMRLDERKLFGMIKRQIAEEKRFLLFWDDRYNALSHRILDMLLSKHYVQFNVNKNQIKNIIFKAIDSFAQLHEDIQEEIVEKIKNYKRRLLVGTDEYELVYEKLYEEELRKRGLL